MWILQEYLQAAAEAEAAPPYRAIRTHVERVLDRSYATPEWIRWLKQKSKLVVAEFQQAR